MRQVLTTFIVAIVAIVWLTDFVTRILAIIWPVVAAALLLVVISAALSASLALVARGLRTLRPEPVPYEVLPLDTPRHSFAQTVQSVFAADTEQSAAIHRDRCDVAVQQFCFVGDRVGFSVLKMSPYISRDHRRIYIVLLTTPPNVILEVDKAGTRWAAGWNYYGLRSALKHRAISLPYPDADLPAVKLTAPGQHTQPTQHTQRSTANIPSRPVYFSPMGG